MTWIAQLTDLHLDGNPPADTRFDLVASWLERLSPGVDGIVLSGDVIELRGIEDPGAVYAALARRLTAIAPVLVIPGNSDDPESLAQAFPSPERWGVPAAGANGSMVAGDAVAVIGLDSSIPGRYEGRLSDSTLAWADEVLSNVPAGMPVLVALHHPPIALGHTMIDGLRLENPDSLAELVERHPSVIGLLAGHTHGGTAAVFTGKPLIVAPGVHSGMRLEQESGGAASGPLDTDVPPAVALHRIEDGTLVTHFRSIAG
ncbi:MAG: metallophosphoesterase [Thermomicrobiales bacterium]